MAILNCNSTMLLFCCICDKNKCSLVVTIRYFFKNMKKSQNVLCICVDFAFNINLSNTVTFTLSFKFIKVQVIRFHDP